MAEKNVFDTLYPVDISGKTEKRNGFTYLSWAWAWAEVKKRYPSATYEIIKFDGIPYVFDEKTGYMVYTNVTIEGITHEMWLPVMDTNNCAMKAEPYEVQTKFKTITVKPATMFDINKTIMRCLVKNLAMFGLGLNIYIGEDMPDADRNEQMNQEKEENGSQKPQKASKTAKKDQEVKQPIMELPADFCTICRLPVMDYDGKTKNGDPVHYSKEDIISRSTTLFNAPVCMSCMMKRARKTAKKEENKQ